MGNQQSVVDIDYNSSGIIKAFHVTDKMINKGDDKEFDTVHAMPTTMPNRMKKKLREMRDSKEEYEN